MMSGMMGMGMTEDTNKEELATTRAIGTLLLENGLTSAKIKTVDDLANLTQPKPEMEPNE